MIVLKLKISMLVSPVADADNKAISQEIVKSIWQINQATEVLTMVTWKTKFKNLWPKLEVALVSASDTVNQLDASKVVSLLPGNSLLLPLPRWHLG
jgi:hypothetical protein